tara:strand:- start:1118 stop:1351 length:234 start_codon:yes stop_codon:yes gene_type:complete
MIIPVKCFTCGKVLANKYLYFEMKVRETKMKKGLSEDEVIYLTVDNIKKTPEGKCLDDLGLTKMCCRRHLLTHVDIE